MKNNIKSKNRNILMLCIIAFLMPRVSISDGNKTQTDKAIILFEHEQDLQFDIFMKWLRQVSLLTEADAIRTEFTKPLPFDEKKLHKDFLNLSVKEVIARHDAPNPTVPERCFFGTVSISVSLLSIDYSSEIRSCSFSCTDKELMGKHSKLTHHAEYFEDFIKECKNKMWDVEELRRIPYPSKSHP
jgi:hypothetical protein